MTALSSCVCTLIALGGLATAPVSGKKSYYEVLELSRDASAQDVKRQFRKLSVKLHPDKNPEADTPKGRKAYQKLQLAHEWLSGDDRRQLYDLYGEWDSNNDRMRGHQFAGRHSTVEFFRDETLIRNVRTEPEANEIFGLKSRRAYLMMLYAPWLTSCMEAADAYRKVAQNLLEETGENGIRLAAVNCESNLQSFCLRYGRLRNQFELPVILLLDPTESLMDRYRGRMVAKELEEYAVASDRGIQHVHTLDETSFQARVANPALTSSEFWMVLFCESSSALCRDLKPAFKRLAFSAKETAKVGLVNCRSRHAPDGYSELEPFCQEQGVQDVPALLAFRRGSRGQQGEVIPLLVGEGEQQNLETAMSMAVLRAMEAVLRLSAPTVQDAEAGDEEEEEDEVPKAAKQSRKLHSRADEF